MNKQIFFIISNVRSGSTAIADILERSKNVKVDIEPDTDELLPLIDKYVYEEETKFTKGTKLQAWTDIADIISKRYLNSTFELYGQKQPYYSYFIPELHRAFDCKFIILLRDPYHTIASMKRWNNELMGNYYTECNEIVAMTDIAHKGLKQEKDNPLYDRVRPRPITDERALKARWPSYTKEDMYMFHYTRLTSYMLHGLSLLRPKDFYFLNMDNQIVDQVGHVAGAMAWLGADKVPREVIRQMLAEKRNSIEWRNRK